MTKPIKLFLLLAVLALTCMITAQTLSAVLSFKRGLLNNWSVLSEYKTDIDKAAYYGADSYSPFGLTPSYIEGIKNNTQTDYIGLGIDYAHTIGIKTYLFMSIASYANNDWDAFKDSVSAQNNFLSNLEWVLQRYPTVDGIELEEPYCHKGIPADGGAAWRAFTNSFFTKCKNVVAKYKPTDQPDKFTWSFNCGSNSYGGVWGSGIDTAYINDNRLFNAYEIQNSGQSLTDFQNKITTWQGWFPNLEVFSCASLNWSSLLDACGLPWPYNSSTCWNQAFFDQVKWAKSVNHSVRIFIQGRLTTSATMWPNDTTPGATAGDKVIYIWGGTQQSYSAGVPLLITSSTSTPTKVEAENFDMMSAGSGQNEAYYDTTLDNQGGAYRTTEYVD
ncbi:MAG: hypothetical protein PHE88_12430, partial [Elusimicrobia bacterium]|nr:hypothetical protein [Elusimicrobiota bacterium]